MGRAGISGAAKFRAYGKTNGQVLWQTDLPVGTTGGPVTYMANGKQYIVLPVGGKGYGSGWLALAVASPSERIDITRAAPVQTDAGPTPPIYSDLQAKRGAKVFDEKCATCHGENTWGPNLQGASFWSSWDHKSARSLYSTIIGAMPPDRPGSLSENTVYDVVAYILQMNSLPQGDKEIVNASELNSVKFVRPK
jgi:mono/diheme cytochrome c family protein